MAAERSIATRNSSSRDSEAGSYSGGVTTIAEMNGPQRAAVILLVLGEDHGRTIWQEFDDEEIRIITRAMAELGTVDADEVERLMLDFVGRLSSGRGHGLVRPDDLALGEDPAERSGRPDHGGDPRAGRPQHVAEARQYRCGRARELPQE
jgi:hypothetical protein